MLRLLLFEKDEVPLTNKVVKESERKELDGINKYLKPGTL